MITLSGEHDAKNQIEPGARSPCRMWRRRTSPCVQAQSESSPVAPRSGHRSVWRLGKCLSKVNLRRPLFLAVALAVSGLAAVIFVTCYTHERIHRYDEIIIGSGRTHGVQPELVRAVIRRESGFNPHAVGRSGEIGLMQVTELAALEWAISSGLNSFTKEVLFDPEVNIQAGTWYLGRALQRWSHKDNPLPYALAEYNAGRTNARRWAADDGGNDQNFINAITFPSTRRYIEDIMRDCEASAATGTDVASYHSSLLPGNTVYQ